MQNEMKEVLAESNSTRAIDLAQLFACRLQLLLCVTLASQAKMKIVNYLIFFVTCLVCSTWHFDHNRSNITNALCGMAPQCARKWPNTHVLLLQKQDFKQTLYCYCSCVSLVYTGKLYQTFVCKLQVCRSLDKFAVHVYTLKLKQTLPLIGGVCQLYMSDWKNNSPQPKLFKQT